MHFFVRVPPLKRKQLWTFHFQNILNVVSFFLFMFLNFILYCGVFRTSQPDSAPFAANDFLTVRFTQQPYKNNCNTLFRENEKKNRKCTITPHDVGGLALRFLVIVERF